MARNFIVTHKNQDGSSPRPVKLEMVDTIKHFLLLPNGQVKEDSSDGTKGDYDLLFTAELDHYGYPRISKNAKSLKVYDQELLPQFVVPSVLSFNGHYGITSYVDDAFNLFKFVSDNTIVEWGLNGYKSNGFLLRTSHTEGEVYNTDGEFEEFNIVFHMHSHPLTNEVGASGFDPGPPGVKGYPKLGGDVKNADIRLLRFRKKGKLKGHEYPNHFVYTVDTKTLYHYTNMNPANKTFSNITSGLVLKKHVFNKNYNPW